VRAIHTPLIRATKVSIGQGGTDRLTPRHEGGSGDRTATKFNFLFARGTRAFVCFFPLWDSGPSGDVPMPLSNATSATDKYRVKAYELLSLAERAGDPEQRADLLRFARMWMSLTEPIEDLPLRKLPHEI
jgi:hypothetical protein